MLPTFSAGDMEQSSLYMLHSAWPLALGTMPKQIVAYNSVPVNYLAHGGIEDYNNGGDNDDVVCFFNRLYVVV